MCPVSRQDATTWKYVGHCSDGERFTIDGVNVWDHEWIRKHTQHAHVKDPRYGQPFSFPVYEIVAGDSRILFAAGEFSNCIWGFYTPEGA